MVALDDSGLAGAALHHVGVNGALAQEVHFAQLLALRLEDPDELLADDLPFPLRVLHACKLCEEALPGVDPDDVHVKLFFEDPLYHVPLVLAQQAVVHENAGQVLADGLVHQHGGHRGIHPAGQAAEDLLVPHLLFNGLNGLLGEGAHLPVAPAAAHPVQEVSEHLLALLGVLHLRVELHGVELFLPVFHGGHRAVGAVSGGREALRQLGDVVVVAHPADAVPHVLKKQGTAVELGHSLAELGHVAVGDLSPQQVGHGLGAVADAQHRHPQLEHSLGAQGRPFLVDAVGPSGEEDALAVPQGRWVGFIILDLAIDPQVSHPAGNELGVLAAKVQHHHALVGVVCHSHLVLFSAILSEGILAHRGDFRKKNRERPDCPHPGAPPAAPPPGGRGPTPCGGRGLAPGGQGRRGRSQPAAGLRPKAAALFKTRGRPLPRALRPAYSTVTDFAKFLGLSMSQPFMEAT